MLNEGNFDFFYSISKDTKVLFELIYPQAKTLLILYPWTWNFTNSIAINVKIVKPHFDFRNNVEDTLECMRDKKDEDITLLEYYVDNYSLNFFPFVVTIDETFLPMSPRTLLEKGASKDISVLIGSNANEGKIIY